MALAAVLFDLDGTLIDTGEDFVIALNQVLANAGRPALPSDTIRNTVSDGARALTQLAFGGNEGEAEFEQYKQQLLDLYLAEIGKHSVLFPGLDQLLQKLEARNIPWGLVTNKPELYAVPLLANMQLDKRCSVLICPDHVSVSKPDPEGLLLACKKLNVNAKDCIYVGDHKRDIDAGRAAGMITIAAGFGFIKADDNFLDWQADYNAEQSQDLAAIVDGIQSRLS